MEIFPFVNVSESLYINDQDRATIRTQVMRDHHQKARTSWESRKTEDTALSRDKLATGRVVGQMQRFRLTQWNLEGSDVSSQKRKHPGSANTTKSGVKLTIFNTRRTSYRPKAKTVCSANFDRDPERTIGLQPRSLQPRQRDPNKDIDQPTVHQSEKSLDSWSSDSLMGHDPDNPQLFTKFLSSNVIPLDGIDASERGRWSIYSHHYFQSSSPFMMHVRNSWFALAHQDPAFSFAALSHYAGGFSLSQRSGDPTEALKMRARSIRLLNKTLASPKAAHSAINLGTVSSLSTYEANNGSTSAIKVHIAGLNKMVSLHGGMQSPEISESLRRLIEWADITAAIVLASSPSIMPFEIPQQPHLSFNLEFNAIIADLSPLLSIMTSWRQGQGNLAASSTHSLTDAPASFDNLWWSDKVYVIQRRLLYMSYLDPNDIREGETLPVLLKQACAVATSILVDAYLRNLGFRARIVQVMARRLQAKLGRIIDNHWEAAELSRIFMEDEESGSKSRYTDVMLWALVIGGVAVESGDHIDHTRAWFVMRIARACDHGGLSSWDDVETRLKEILWDAELEASKGSLGREVGAVRKWTGAMRVEKDSYNLTHRSNGNPGSPAD